MSTIFLFKCWVRIPIRRWIFFFLLLTLVSSLHFSFLRWIHYLPNGLTCFFIRSTHYVDTMTLFMWLDLTPSSASLEEWIFPRSSFALALTASNDGSWSRCVCYSQNSVFWYSLWVITTLEGNSSKTTQFFENVNRRHLARKKGEELLSVFKWIPPRDGTWLQVAGSCK